MSLFAQVQKITAFQKITAEYNNIVSHMQSAKAGYNYLQEQSTAMSQDSNYTAEDIAEVDTMLTNLNAMAVSLTAPSPEVVETITQ